MGYKNGLQDKATRQDRVQHESLNNRDIPTKYVRTGV